MLALPNYSSLGSIIAPGTADVDDAEVALYKAGWKRVGDGADCIVYRSPQQDRVVKLMRETIQPGAVRGNLITVKAAQKLPSNPHLPKVYGTLEASPTLTAVETEFLEAIDRPRYHGFRAASGFGYGQPGVEGSVAGLKALPESDLREALICLAETALETGPGFLWDTHDGNLMVRPGTDEVVLNDTLYRPRA